MKEMVLTSILEAKEYNAKLSMGNVEKMFHIYDWFMP